ncbi:MAG: HAD family hydrolase [Alphaproteobacteria bacterium]
MKEKAPKKEIKLIVSDIDNTIADYFDVWGKGIAKAVTMLAKSRGISEDAIYEDIKTNTPGGDIFHPNIDYLIRNTTILQPKTEKEKARYDRDDAKIMHEVNKMRIAGDKAYSGVMATITKAKASGAKVVFYTDAAMSVAIGRLANMGIPVDMIDGLYARKDDAPRKAPIGVRSKVTKYRKALEARISDNMYVGEGWKPNPDLLTTIMKKAGVENPKEVVMVGDNVKSDGGSGIGAGCEYAWAKYGASISQEAQDTYAKLNTKKGYELGVKGHLKQMNDGNRPTVILEKSFADLTKYYKFVPANDKVIDNSKEKANADVVNSVVAKLREGR